MADSSLTALRSFYNTGETRSIQFRRKQLMMLKEFVISNEDKIAAALYKDLHKSREEAYASETGIFLMELNHTLANFGKWSSPVAAKTSFLNFPSSSKIYREPLGVVLIIGPWNYPFQLIMIPLMAAIAAGNCVVVKPSEVAVATAALIEKMLTELFPENFVRTLQGAGEDVIPPAINSFRFDHIFYTGSSLVGKEIYKMAASQLIPVTLELGGKSPAVVEADADIQVSARRIVLGKWLNAGQTCIAPDYLLVHESRKEELVSAIKETLSTFYTADARDSYDYGRIIHEKRMRKLVSFLDQGKLLYGGDYDMSELYFGPTLMDGILPHSAIMQEEIFGPILPVLTYRDTAEAMEIVSHNPDPLAFYLFTQDKKIINEWINNTSFGGGCINNTAYHFANYHLPFGGVRASGMGAYHGRYTFDVFSRPKAVMKTPLWFDPRIKYPSFKGKINLLKRMFR